jgi:hypothetical protein
MSERRLPLHPNRDQLKHQAKDLLREMQRDGPRAQLADAQHALARSYGAHNWTRLIQSCRLATRSGATTTTRFATSRNGSNTRQLARCTGARRAAHAAPNPWECHLGSVARIYTECSALDVPKKGRVSAKTLRESMASPLHRRLAGGQHVEETYDRHRDDIAQQLFRPCRPDFDPHGSSG